MRRVLPATPAEFLDLQPIRSGFPVLGGRIIPLFAITALQRNDLSGHSAPSFFLCGAPLFAITALQRNDLSGHSAPSFFLCGAGALAREKLCGASLRLDGRGRSSLQLYCTISLIVPAPTVCPPSRMAKRKPFSIATGVISSITSWTLSPGITISVPLGSSATPVTSVVRK